MRILLEAFACMYALWVFYLAVMTLLRARRADTLPKVAYYLGIPVVYTGYFIDIFVNFFILSFLILELPKYVRWPSARIGIRVEWTVTARLSRHTHDSSGWRQKIAMWIGANLLDPFDPSGKHLR